MNIGGCVINGTLVFSLSSGQNVVVSQTVTHVEEIGSTAMLAPRGQQV